MSEATLFSQKGSKSSLQESVFSLLDDCKQELTSERSDFRYPFAYPEILFASYQFLLSSCVCF